VGRSVVWGVILGRKSEKDGMGNCFEGDGRK